MGQNKVKRTEEAAQDMMQKVFIQEVPDLLFHGCKVLIAVPAITGIDPAELAEGFCGQLAQMKARAEQPSPREMMDMSIKGLPVLTAQEK